MPKLSLEFYKPDFSEMVACFESKSFNLSHSKLTYDSPGGGVITLRTTHHFDMLIEKTLKDGQINPSLLVRYFIDGMPEKRINFLKIVDTEVQNGIAGVRLKFDIAMEGETLLHGFK